MRARTILFAWLATDLILFIASYALAYFLRVGWIFSSDFPFLQYIEIVSLIAPAWLVVLLTTGTFRLTQSQRGGRNLLALVYANIVGSSLFALAYFFHYGLFFSRLLLVEAFVLSIIIIRIWHLCYERLARRSFWRNPPAFPTLIVGVTRESKHLITLLQKAHNPLRPVAILDGHGAREKEINGIPVLGKLDKLEEVLREHNISHLVQCSNLEQSVNLLSACRQHHITYLLLPSVLGIVERDERVESLEGCAVTMVSTSRRLWRSLLSL